MYSAIFKTFLLALCIVANTHLAYAQTASILPPAKTQYLDNSGKPLTSGKVYNYIPSTTTFKSTWQDAAETIPNTNPVILDAGGRAKILGDGFYRQIVKDRYDNIIWDAVTSSTGSGATPSISTGDGDLVGTVKPWAGIIAPNQYQFTYGQEISRTTYAALYAAITSSQAVFCNSGSPTLNGLTDTNSFWIGMSLEVSCLGAGFSTVVSKTATTVVMAANANVTTNTTATFFPWGRGNGTTTFNLPDLRGFVLAGNNIMGGVSGVQLNTTYFGATDPNSAGAAGGVQSTTLATANLPPYTPAATAITLVSTTSQVIQTTVLVDVDATGAGAKAGQTGPTGVSAISSTLAGGGSFTGTAQGGTSTPFSRVQPTKTTNYIIKVTPDTNSATASGVTSLSGMTGDIACGTGMTCTGNIISVSAITLTVGSSPITLGTNTRVLYDNGGLLGEYDISGTGNVAMTTNPVFVTPNLGTPSAVNLTNATNFPYATGGTGLLPLANGGLNANNTASNGGIFWSNATQGQILAGTATARLPLLSGATATPVWGAYTIPASVTSGGILCFTSTSVSASSVLQTANAIMLGGGAGVCPSPLASLGTTSTVLHGNAGGAPTFGAVVSADLNITATNCTNQFVSAISTGGVGTCNIVNVANVTGTLAIANGGTAQTTALAARGSSGLNIDGATSTGDADYTILSTDRMVYHTALSAARTDTLPAANSVNAGQTFYITDFRGVASGTNTITLQRAGADTVNGATTVVAVNAQYGAGIFWSDGVSRWTFQPTSSGGGGGTVTQITCDGVVITTSGTCPPKYGYTNCTLAASAAASALTIALKDNAGSDPSASSPCTLNFRNATGTTGSWSQVVVTSATSLVISSGSTLGVTSSTAFRIWIVGFNDAGTFRLAAINAAISGGVFGLTEGIPASSTAEGGAGAADSAGVFYTATAVTSKAYMILGYIEWSASGLTAGTWTTTNLNFIQAFGPGINKPGDIVQRRSSTTSTATTTTSSTFQNTNISSAITLTSAANYIVGRANSDMYQGGAFTNSAVGTVFRDSTNLGAQATSFGSASQNIASCAWIFSDTPNSTSSITYMVKLKSLDGSGSVTIAASTGGVSYGIMQIEEVMR